MQIEKFYKEVGRPGPIDAPNTDPFEFEVIVKCYQWMMNYLLRERLKEVSIQQGRIVDRLGVVSLSFKF